MCDHCDLREATKTSGPLDLCPACFEEHEELLRQPDRRVFTLDGAPLRDGIRELLDANEDFTDEEVTLIQRMQPGDEMILGGGAGADFVLRRMR